MGRALALFTYKMRFFFGPSIRGRFGPLAYVALILIFLPSGFFTGYGIGVSIRTAESAAAMSVLSAIGIALPGFPIQFEQLPIPSTAFAALGLAVLRGAPASLADIAVAAAYLGGIALVWLLLSNSYIFHGIKPTMSAGFGQVDLGSRMEIQRRITARFGGVTTRIRLRTDRGSETGLMTRFHLVRIWRDGSVVFVIFFALLAILPAALGGGAAGGSELSP